MSNENVSQELLQEFYVKLIDHGVRASCVQPSNGNSFALGYVFSMIESGNMNDDVMRERMVGFNC